MTRNELYLSTNKETLRDFYSVSINSSHRFLHRTRIKLRTLVSWHVITNRIWIGVSVSGRRFRKKRIWRVSLSEFSATRMLRELSTISRARWIKIKSLLRAQASNAWTSLTRSPHRESAPSMLDRKRIPGNFLFMTPDIATRVSPPLKYSSLTSDSLHEGIR